PSRRTMKRSLVQAGSSVAHQCRHDAASSGSSARDAVATTAANAASSSVAGRNARLSRRSVTDGSVIVGTLVVYVRDRAGTRCPGCVFCQGGYIPTRRDDMTLDRARWDTGLTYDAFKAAMTRNQDRFAENEARVALDPATVRTFKSLPKGLRVLVLAEDWCGDVVANLPILGRLAKEVPTLDVRIFYRDQNPDLIDRKSVRTGK